MSNKQYLRKEYIIKRNNINNKSIKSNKIFNKIIKLPIYKKSRVIAIYYSMESEVDTTRLIRYMLDDKKEVYLPRVLDNNNMEFYKVNSLDDINNKNKFGIYEPNISNNMLNKELLDLIIIPGICFDLNYNRIGFGKGYYDKYLSDTNIYKIALCFEEQILKDKIINTSDNDIKMNIIITDKNIYGKSL